MPILFGTLATLVMAFALWSTFKNADEYKHQISLRENQEKEVVKNTTEKDERNDELEEEVLATELLVEENVALQADLETKAAERDQLESDVSSAERKINDLESEINTASEQLKELGDVETLIPQIQRIKSEIAQLEDDIEKDEAKLASLKQVSKDTQGVIDLKIGETDRVASGKSLLRLSTTINTVYSNWGFVTLKGGDIQGVVPDSILDVMRDGDVIAKLKVTTVEPNRAAADIIKESVKGDHFLRSGDQVVAEVDIAATTKPLNDTTSK